MSDPPRPVWLTREQRRLLSNFYSRNTGITVVAEIVDAWDAAPADPAEAVAHALYDRPTEGRAVEIVLRALGMPDE